MKVEILFEKENTPVIQEIVVHISYVHVYQWYTRYSLQKDVLVTYIWINIGSGHGLLPNGTKPQPDTMLIYHQWVSVAVT